MITRAVLWGAKGACAPGANFKRAQTHIYSVVFHYRFSRVINSILFFWNFGFLNFIKYLIAIHHNPPVRRVYLAIHLNARATLVFNRTSDADRETVLYHTPNQGRLQLFRRLVQTFILPPFFLNLLIKTVFCVFVSIRVRKIYVSCMIAYTLHFL